jgi:hypothetical protein
VYENGKMRPVETIPGIEEGERMMQGVNLTEIYCKHFCRCHEVPVVQQ